MPFACALSLDPETLRAVGEVLEKAQLTASPDLAVVFFSAHHADAAAEIAATLQQRLNPRALVGCVGESIVGKDREVEDAPALSLWLAHWGERVSIEPFHLTLEQTPDGPSFLGWPDGLLGVDGQHSALLTLGNPFSFPADLYLGRVTEGHPGLRVVGGMASGARDPETNCLVFGGKAVSSGAVGVLLQGLPGLRTVVSQGCRPIGRPLIITRGEENIILELGGKSPLVYLQELWQELTPRDQQLVQQGLHLGLVINEYRDDFRQGDFLVRNVLGIDRNTGALAITDLIRVGQTVQFHVRDAATADEDLRALLQADREAHPNRAAAALLFTCNGRGTRLFPAPNHDVEALRQEAGDLPVAGLFAQGEFGPVAGQNFMHGFTASVALFEE
jgi:small ligand-binding sensory domain FIST